MKIFVLKEDVSTEARVAVIPDGVKKLVGLGAAVEVEAGLGAGIEASDEDYKKAGATLSEDRRASLAAADMVLRLNKPLAEDVAMLKAGCIHVSLLDPFMQQPLLEQLAAQGATAISMEMVPRTTLAQKMDVLSSQASLAGYVAVILAAERLNKVLPMMMTPAGTIVASRFFIIGAGVAGLQAIATSKRLGARVEAYDTRPVVAEQVESLGAKFVKIDIGETGQTKDGYAKALTDEQIQAQRDAMAKHCAAADAVITTAQVFGRKAPRIITTDMIRKMSPGSVIIDLAVETGGNVEGSRVNEEIDFGGVKIVGLANLPGRVPIHASQMFSSNLCNLVEHFWDKEAKTFNLNLEDEIMKGCLVTHGNEICNDKLKNTNA